MHITRSAEDPEFREAAKAVLLHAEDMIPVEGQPGSWRLPLELLMARLEMKRFYFLFEKKKVC